MVIPKFKVGDRVKVLRKTTEYDGYWGDGWVSEMDRAIGKVGEITYVNIYSPNVYNLDEDIAGSWNYPGCVLRKVSEVGTQLLFDFMKE